MLVNADLCARGSALLMMSHQWEWVLTGRRRDLNWIRSSSDAVSYKNRVLSFKYILWWTFIQNTGHNFQMKKENLKCETQMEIILSAVIHNKILQHNICTVFLSYKIFIFIKVINITGRPIFDCCCFAVTNLCKILLYLLLIFIVHIECQWQNVVLKPFLKKCKRPLIFIY